MASGNTPSPPNAGDICAIVVTYHPDPGLPVRLGRVLTQVGALVIVDNGSGDASIQMLREIAASPSITLVLNGENWGVARALNVGIESAIKRGFSWVLLLDQDSRVDEDMVRGLLAVQAAFPAAAELAVIGSGFRDMHLDYPPEGVDAGVDEPWEEVKNVITSGSLIPLAAHAVVGPFREEFFIDHVDMEYCFRARALGLRVIKTRKILMSHAIGGSTRHNLLWMKKWTTNHSPDRHYYFARNDTVMLREYGGYVFGLWAFKSVGRCFRSCKRVLLYEEMKTRKIMAVVQGWWDGMRGRLGPRKS